MFFVFNYLRAKMALVFILLFVQQKAQTYFGENPVKWENTLPYSLPSEASRYDSSDLVVLNDVTEFYFYSEDNEKIRRNIKYKINTSKGVEILKRFKTPESFDYAYDENLNRQGRAARIKIPYLREYKMLAFAARRYVNNRWTNLSVKDTYEKIRWISSTGEFVDEDMLVLKLNGLMVGDIVEIYYEASFNASYGHNLFYFSGPYPKLSCEYNFLYKIKNVFAKTNFILPVNIPPENVVTLSQTKEGFTYVTKQIKASHIKANNFPVNSFEGVKLPHVKADFDFYRTFLFQSGFTEVELIKAGNFQWLILTDTLASKTVKIYDKQFNSIRKFIATLPPTGTDAQNIVFFSALCDTFNNFRYISANHLFYKESNLYNLYSGEHILKRRLPEEAMGKLYMDILADKGLFYYTANIQDKRYGEHTLKHRTHQGYENQLIALPDGDSYIYFMLRYGGVKYHLNELPFYHEGVLAALIPNNFQTTTKDKAKKLFKFIHTHKGTFNENVRTENALVRINPDSLAARFTTKESLSGQFSTVLRHYYNGDLIDSTIAPHYFKRCVDKPRSSDIRIKHSSHIETFPYRYNYNCSHNVKLENPETLSLHNWFSFLLNKTVIYEAPNYDYYFDFEFSDSYNFQLEFTKPVVLLNSDQFSKKISNDYFELESAIEKLSEQSYLVKVKLAVKKGSLPVNQNALLMDLVAELEKLNQFQLALK